ncbi:hypothetical protein [Sorangium sp. So ce341]|uniref:hypothetical protein n=1 Tax=Sorangium sp. So ce341 TaxID=3133302 RepID=UPI003F5FC2D6
MLSMFGPSRRRSRQVRATLRVCVAAALLSPCAAGERLARAADPPLRLAFGGGAAARWVAGQWLPAFPLELTLQPYPVVSTSLGGVISDGTLAHGYVELGVYFGVSLGAGVGLGNYASPDGRESDTAFHVSVGVPIPFYPPTAIKNPMDLLDERWWGYLLPYYRPSWGPWPGAAHEVGLMLKASYLLSGSYGKLF